MKFGRYQIKGELGSGSMGVVYSAHDPQIDRQVAIKVLREERLSNEEFARRFLKEARAIGRLSHPNIVTVYDVGEDHGTVYIAMEFLVGKPLNEFMKERRLSPDEVVNIGAQVAEALDYAHLKGIIHRDIKPSNIFLTSENRPITTDFGIARIEDPSFPQQTQTGVILGTPAYMSPEQVVGQRVDARTDIFSLGVILYELTTRRRPFGGENLQALFRAIMEDSPTEPIKIDPSLPKPLSKLIMKSISKAPEKRFQTGKEMAEALKACIEKKESDAFQQPRVDRKWTYLGLRAVVVLLAIGVAGGVIFFLISGQQPSDFIPLNKRAPSVVEGERNKARNEKKTSSTLETSSADSKRYTKEKKEGLSPSGINASSSGKDKLIDEPTVNAVLKVGSSPIGAEVFMDGSLKGKTPLELKLPLGKYEVRLSLQDYYEWKAQVNLEREGEVPLFARLIPKDTREP